ncbi:MAG: hypothetical protein KAR30_00725 [Gammaproteobacteria bacterium]|nr:hypothetical protein [Gammaproteobacteria bacterium]
MCFFFSFLPATFWFVIGYFVLFASTKAEGGIQKFGRILAIWIFIIASFFPMMGLYITVSDLCPIEELLGAVTK